MVDDGEWYVSAKFKRTEKGCLTLGYDVRVFTLVVWAFYLSMFEKRP